MRRLLASAAVVLAAAVAAPPATATPVKCAEDDSTPDGRVFPEANRSTNFLRIDEFECGIALLESRYPELLETRTIGKSKGERPIYDIVMTDERVSADKQKLLVVSSIHGDEVGGREGRFIEEATDRDSVMLRWAIDDPYASYLAVWAEIQGPDETELRRQVQALVESIASRHRASGTAPRSAEQHHGD